MSKDQVSRWCRGLDEQVTAFRERPLERAYPYLWLEAKVRHEAPFDRAGGRSPPAVCRSRPLKLRAA
jgi:putative transposase